MKLTWKTKGTINEYYANSVLIVSGPTTERQILQVILWIRQNLGLDLAGAKAVWDQAVKKNGEPFYNGPTFKELEAKRKKELEEISKICNPLTREQIQNIIGEEDICKCSHLGRDHTEYGDCVLCDCKSFDWVEEKVN